MKISATRKKAFDHRLQQLYGPRQMAAATVAALGLGTAASAQTITAFTAGDLGAPHVPVTENGRISFTAGSSGPHFQFYGYYSNGAHINLLGINAGAMATTAFAMANVNRGVAIQGLQFVSTSRAAARAYGAVLHTDLFHVATGNGTGYVGFKQNFNGHDYYGWLHITITKTAGRLDELTVTNGPVSGHALAYSTGPITAGGLAAVPEPASMATGLGLVALGAAGLREFRRRRQQAA